MAKFEIMPNIHATAIVDPSAQIAADVEIGPYCIVGANVVLGEGCRLLNHVVIGENSSFGKRNTFYSFAVVGQKTMDLKYKGEPTVLEAGDDNEFREGCVISRSTDVGGKTVIGNRNHFLVNAHAGHDCVIGDDNIFSGFVGLAGHVTVGNNVIVSAFAAVHQFCRLGDHAMLGANARVSKDVPPYTMVEGAPAEVRGLNLIGLNRRGFSPEQVRSLKNAYKILFFRREGSLEEAVASVREQGLDADEHVACLLAFLGSSQRGITR